MGNYHTGRMIADHLACMVEDYGYAQNRQEQRKKMTEVFNAIDQNHNGAIDHKETRDLMDLVIEGYHAAAQKVLDDHAPHHEVSPAEVANLFKEADKEKDKELTFDEFMVLIDNLCELLIEGKNMQNLSSIAASHKASKQINF
eukprot:CAMPEP_0117047466 /NCGR_PEP_ID=MMETSP0472-20121206/32806_1 /TAXON_ID=693140 ORGANISM="Tiarina fusus, Strain LIS" /NCGR_SAMPLE_ID=MMETSP0472 /ASSEMBLY_ACC=CAM_ASM_000603 /LENGTH=142 /DNA_ID=CAMNT_0004760183 /DNA_START=9 /DNA_END=434 /DNA_ORIENTATION=+